MADEQIIEMDERTQRFAAMMTPAEFEAWVRIVPETRAKLETYGGSVRRDHADPRRVLVLWFGTETEHVILIVSPTSPPGRFMVPRADEAEAARIRDERGADHAGWVPVEEESNVYREMAWAAQLAHPKARADALGSG